MAAAHFRRVPDPVMGNHLHLLLNHRDALVVHHDVNIWKIKNKGCSIKFSWLLRNQYVEKFRVSINCENASLREVKEAEEAAREGRAGRAGGRRRGHAQALHLHYHYRNHAGKWWQGRGHQLLIMHGH